MNRVIWRAPLAVATIIWCSCGRSAPTNPAAPSATAPSSALTKVSENGPIKATVKVWPEKPSLDGVLHVELTVVAASSVVVNLPFQEAGLGRFRVENYSAERRSAAKGQTEYVQHYELSAPSSGKHRVPPFRVEYDDGTLASVPSQAAGSGSANGGGSGAGSGAGGPTGKELLTDEVAIDIAPVDPALSQGELRPAAGSLDEAAGKPPIWRYLLIPALLIWALLGFLLYRKLAARKAIARKLSAYDLAVGKLTKLQAQGAPAGEATDPWFVELSAIVRGYLEDRYDIAAPERTTEEFLSEAVKSAELSAQHRSMLVSFLQQCDRVKFAGYQPAADESLAALGAARGFIEESRLVATEAT